MTMRDVRDVEYMTTTITDVPSLNGDAVVHGLNP